MTLSPERNNNLVSASIFSCFRAYHGVGMIVLAAALWSTAALLASFPSITTLPSEYRGAIIAFWRALFALVLLVPMVRRPRWKWGMLPMALLFAAMNWTYLTAMIGGPPANAIWLQNLAPAWVMLAGIFWFGEKSLAKDWIMLACCTTGVGLILIMELTHSSTGAWWAPWLGLLSGVAYAGVVLSLRRMRDQDSAWLITLNHIVTAMAMAPLAFRTSECLPSGNTWWILAAFGMLQMGLPYLLFANGLKTTPSHVASMITLLEPVLLPCWLFLMWHNDSKYEPPSWWTIAGGCLILIGLIYRFSSRDFVVGQSNAAKSRS